MPGFDLKDYVTVAERVTAFYAKYPDGSLQSEIVELNESRVVMRAYAYRTATDERPGIGYSSLGIPGTTPYTRGSEVENCESSAWGRAIAALGFEVKRGIASGDEIANKQDDGPPHLPPRQDRNTIDPPAKMGAVTEELIGRVSRRGTIRKGTSEDYQLEARQGPDGHVIGFRLEVGAEKHIPQCLVTGPIGEALFLATAGKPESLVGTSATVAGVLYYVKNDKGSWYRLHVDRFENADYVLPSDVALPEPPEDLHLVGETA
jgi:hypothetical protein